MPVNIISISAKGAANIRLTLCHDLALCLDSGFVTFLTKDRVVVHDGLDESLFEIAVDDSSSLWCLDAVADCPLSDFVSTGGEEATELECLAHGDNDLGKSRLGAKSLALLGCFSISLEASEALLK